MQIKKKEFLWKSMKILSMILAINGKGLGCFFKALIDAGYFSCRRVSCINSALQQRRCWSVILWSTKLFRCSTIAIWQNWNEIITIILTIHTIITIILTIHTISRLFSGFTQLKRQQYSRILAFMAFSKQSRIMGIVYSHLQHGYGNWDIHLYVQGDV